MKDQPLHLLIVDDEEAHVEAIRRAFDTAGTNADIHAAGTLREYREQVAAHPPDIALVDLNLPDGRATEILTLPPEDAPFPVLVITAFGNQQTVVEVMKAGALDYVVKSPEAFATMPRTVESALREWNLLQNHKRVQLTLQMTQRCVDRASDAVFWIAPDARLLYVNEAACKSLGYSRDELLAMSVPDIDPDYQANVWPAHWTELRQSGSMIFESRHRAKDGRVYPTEVSANYLNFNGLEINFAFVRDISERKRVEQALRESELKHRMLFETANDAILLIRDGRFVDCNMRALLLFGCNREQIVGAPPQKLSPPTQPDGRQSDEKAREEIRKALTEGSRFFEWEHCRPDGTPFTVEVNLNRLELGGETLLQAIVRDITGRKQAEEQIRKTNRSLRMISDCNQELVRATNETDLLQGICRIAVEHGGYRMVWVGYTEHDEAKSVRPVAQFGFEEGYLDTVEITWADVERGRGPTGTAIRTGQPVIARNIPTDPTFGPWREAAVERGYASSLTLPLVADGKILGALMLYAAMPDAFDAEEVALLTELANDLAYGIGALRHRAERERAEAEVTRTAREWQATFDATNDAVWLLDKEQRVMRSNRTAERIFRRPCAELVGKHCWEIVHGTASPIPECPIQRAKKSLHREISELQIGPRWFEITCDPILDAAGQYAGAVHIVSDITERRRAEQALRKQSEELRARNEELERFNNASVGRELRMIELKQEINQLCHQAGLPRRYPLDFTDKSERTDGPAPPIAPGQP